MLSKLLLNTPFDIKEMMEINRFDLLILYVRRTKTSPVLKLVTLKNLTVAFLSSKILTADRFNIDVCTV